jgi:transcription elongation factor SPT6
LTEDDDLIRAQDIPERMQLATSSLSNTPSLSINQTISEGELDAASSWVVSRMGAQKEDDFFRPNGRYHDRLGDLVQAITFALRFLFVNQLEVPYIWTHRRDFLSHFNLEDMRSQIDLLSLQDLWRIYALGQKYRALLDRRNAVNTLYERLGVSDEYFKQEIQPKLEAVETVADATEWLNMKYKDNKRDFFGSQLIGDMSLEDRKHKLPSRISAYEIARRSIVSKLADVSAPFVYIHPLSHLSIQAFGIKMHDVVLNFLANEKVHFIDDYELNPEAYAEQFTEAEGPGSSGEATLSRARMILATELGKDPLLRDHVRDLFKKEAHVSCTPTERGLVKIDEFKPWFVSDICLLTTIHVLIIFAELQVPRQEACPRDVEEPAVLANSCSRSGPLC